MNKLGKGLILGLALCSFTGGGMANQLHQVSRYTFVAIKPTPNAIDPLTQTVDITFPGNVKMVSQAIQFVLGPTGYSLPQEKDVLDPALIMVGAQKLPASQRRMKGTVKEVLEVLAGPNFVLVRDDVRRLIVLDYWG